LHNAKYVFDDLIIEVLNRLKHEGYIRSVGVSIYEPEEAKKGITRENLDFLQLPYSIFDQRMLLSGIFDLAHEKKINLHSRSAFVQGLIYMNENEVPPFLEKAKPIVRQLDDFCKENAISRIQLAIGFIKQQTEISYLVFGVDNMKQLIEIINCFNDDIQTELIEKATAKFAGLDADVFMPSHWVGNRR
jgi:aryl-alcohol dehydrogenase-like predicted oxidoreductase